MPFYPPEEYTPASQSRNPDYTTYERDDSGPPLNYRWPTPPPGEDGSTENIDETVSPP